MTAEYFLYGARTALNRAIYFTWLFHFFHTNAHIRICTFLDRVQDVNSLNSIVQEIYIVASNCLDNVAIIILRQRTIY